MDAMKYALSVSISFCTILLLNNSWFNFSEILTHLMVLVAIGTAYEDLVNKCTL